MHHIHFPWLYLTRKSQKIITNYLQTHFWKNTSQNYHDIDNIIIDDKLKQITMISSQIKILEKERVWFFHWFAVGQDIDNIIIDCFLTNENIGQRQTSNICSETKKIFKNFLGPNLELIIPRSYCKVPSWFILWKLYFCGHEAWVDLRISTYW